MTKTKIKATPIKDNELIQAMYDAKEEGSDVHFGFLLGAGASVDSGIPLTQELCETWLKTIRQNDPEEAKKWEGEKLSEHYSDIFEARFRANPDIGDEYFQQWINKASPSIGYLFLAQILTETKHKFVVTTNFDTMTEDALFSLNSKPLVIGHESLAEFVKTTKPTRPVIVKAHRDFLLKPQNSNEGTGSLKPAFKAVLDSILKETHLVVLGYGGNDKSVTDYLCKNQERKAIYWCCRDKNKLSQKVKNTLTERDFIVENKGFDRFMLKLNDKFKFKPLIHKDDVNKSQLVEDAKKQVTNYQKQLEKLSKEELSKEERKVLEKQMPNWWSCELEVDKAENAEDKNALYLQCLVQHPDNFVIQGNYANFLKDIRKYDEAEEYYKLALKLEPNHTDINGNYANFLKDIRKYDEAEEYYKLALKLEPNHADINGNYALFLTDIRKEHDEAEKHYKIALKSEPNNANANGNYALFLTDIRKEHDEAEKHYKVGLRSNPNDVHINNNYANFLTYICKKYDKAEEHYKVALKSKPNNVNINSNYALFLTNIRQEHDKAEEHYKITLKSEPNNANANGNYAGLLLSQGKKKQANEYLERAFACLTTENDLPVELWFYRLAYYPDDRTEAMQQLNKLLDKGMHSIYWDFSNHIKQAEKAGFKPITLLQEYADKITQK